LTTRRFLLCETFATLIAVMIFSIARGSNVQVFHLTSGNSEWMSMTLKVGQQVSGVCSVTSVGDDRQIDFRVMNSKGIFVDYGTISGFAEFNFTADEDGDYTFQFFNRFFAEKTVSLTYDVTAAEASGPDNSVYMGVLAVIVFALALTFIFFAYDQWKLRRSTRQIKRRPMVRAVFWKAGCCV
jgi:hypothetical protein